MKRTFPKEREQKLKELDAIILHCAGFMAEYYTDKPEVVQGQMSEYTLNVITRSNTPIQLVSISNAFAVTDLKNVMLGKDEVYTKTTKIKLAKDQPITEP